MTCIIGHRDGWMVADRRTTACDTLLNHFETSKILRAGTRGSELLVASSGPAVLRARICEALRNKSFSQDIFDAVVHAVRDQPGDRPRGHALVLTNIWGEPQLYEICSLGSVGKVSWHWWAIGSGYQAALGYLRGKRDASSEAPLTPEGAKQAINFAAELNTDVGDGYQTEQLENL